MIAIGRFTRKTVLLGDFLVNVVLPNSMTFLTEGILRVEKEEEPLQNEMSICKLVLADYLLICPPICSATTYPAVTEKRSNCTYDWCE